MQAKIIISETEGFVYQSHHGGDFYVADRDDLDDECGICQDSDWLIGYGNSPEELRNLMVQQLLHSYNEQTEQERQEDFAQSQRLIQKLYQFPSLNQSVD